MVVGGSFEKPVLSRYDDFRMRSTVLEMEAILLGKHILSLSTDSVRMILVNRDSTEFAARPAHAFCHTNPLCSY